MTEIVDIVQDENFMIILHNCGNKGHCTSAMTSVGAMGYLKIGGKNEINHYVFYSI